MTLSQTAARGALVTFAGQGLKFTVQIATLVVLARILTPNDYGTVTMVTAIVGLALILGDFGLSMAAVQARILTKDQKSNLFWINSGIGFGSTIVVFLLAHPIAAFYGNPDLVALTQFLSITFLLMGINTQFKAELTRQMRFTFLSAADVGAQAAGFVVALITALSGFSYWALAWQQITITVVTLLLTSVFARWRPGLPNVHSEMKKLLTFGANTMGVQVITYISSNVDSISIGKVWGTGPLGLYNRAFQIFALPMQQLAAPMTRVAVPVLSRISDPDQYQRYIERAQMVLCYVLVGAFALISSVAHPLFLFLFGSAWSGSVPIFQLLAIGGVFQGLAYVYYWIFLSKALTGLQLKYSLIGRAIMTGLIIFGVIWGPVGVAIGYSVGLAIIWLLYTVFAIHKAGVDRAKLILTAVRPILAFALMFSIVQVVDYLLGGHLNDFVTLLIEGVVAVAFLALLYIIARPYRRDFGVLIQTLQLVRRRRAS